MKHSFTIYNILKNWQFACDEWMNEWIKLNWILRQVLTRFPVPNPRPCWLAQGYYLHHQKMSYIRITALIISWIATSKQVFVAGDIWRNCRNSSETTNNVQHETFYFAYSQTSRIRFHRDIIFDHELLSLAIGYNYMYSSRGLETIEKMVDFLRKV